MASKQKRKVAQRNGAKAAGSKTPQGIQNSAMNALRHGLTSQTLVLANESPSKFAELLQMYIDKFQPQDGVEMNLVDEMVAARWRQQRGWVIQTASIDLQMENQDVEVRSEPGRLAQAFTAMANQEKVLELLMRYETSFSRMHDRAMKALYRLREEQNLRNDPKPQDLRNDPKPQDFPNDPKPAPQPPPNRPPVRPECPHGPVETNPAIVSIVDPPNRRLKLKT